MIGRLFGIDKALSSGVGRVIRRGESVRRSPGVFSLLKLGGGQLRSDPWLVSFRRVRVLKVV